MMAIFLMICGLFGSEAHAALIAAHYCVDFTLDYDDGATGDLLTGTEVAGRGVLLRFVRPDGSYFGYYMDWDGSDKGCNTLLIDDAVSYTVKVVMQASVNGNILTVERANGNIYTKTVATNFTPTVSGEYGWTVGPAGGVRIMAAAMWAMQRRGGGISGETFDFVVDGCAGVAGAGSCERWPGSGIYIDDSNGQNRRKFVIVHELGHAMTDAANGSNEDDNDPSALRDDCTPGSSHSGYDMNSKEYQSNAAVEGIALFYAAVAFNHDQQYDDCVYSRPWKADWNADGDTDDAVDVAVFSCEMTPVAGVDSGGDYYTDYCQGGFSGIDNNRGTQFDWLRHFWDLTTDQQVTVATILEIWDAANPHTWNSNGDGTGTSYPSTRLYDAAYTVGGSSLQNKWDTSMTYNGVDR